MYMCMYGDQVVCALHSFSHYYYLLRGLPSSYTCICSRLIWRIMYGVLMAHLYMNPPLFSFHFLILFSFMFMLFVSYSYSFVGYAYLPLCYVIYICSLGFLSSAAFLFLRQVLVWKLGMSGEYLWLRRLYLDSHSGLEMTRRDYLDLVLIVFSL